MTNKTKKSKWLKLALISTATVSTLATIPAAICAKNTTPTSLNNLEATGYVNVTFGLKQEDKEAGATISGKLIVKVKSGKYFATVNKPTASMTGHSFKGWFTADSQGNERQVLDNEKITADMQVYAAFTNTTSITIKGKTEVALEETTTYTAITSPETTVKWYVTDSESWTGEPSSQYATISNDEGSEGVLTPTKLSISTVPTYVFAVPASEPTPTSIDPNATNVLKIKIMDASAVYADKILVEYTDGELYYVINPDQFYTTDNESIHMKSISDSSAGVGVSKKDFDYPITFGKNVSVIKDNFLPIDVDTEGNPIGFIQFKNTITFNNVVSIGDNFLMGNDKYNNGDDLAPLDLSKVTSIGDNFLSDCTAFNQNIYLGDNIEHIGDDFMRGCTNFEEELILPESLHHIGVNFMYNCTDQTAITINCAASAFADSNSSFAVDWESEETSHEIEVKCGGEADLSQLIDQFPTETGSKEGDLVRSFKEALDWTKGVVAIQDEDGHYHYCENLTDSHICDTEGDIITTDGSYDRSRFNLPLYLNPSITAIPDNFLYGCSDFNQTLDLSNIKTIGEFFLGGCSSFNSELTIPNVLTIGSYFLYSCTNFNKDITLPGAITSVGANFMRLCDAMVSTITINCAITVFNYEGENNKSFTANSSTSPAYVQGTKIDGLTDEQWTTFHNTMFPDLTSGDYRKLIQAPHFVGIPDTMSDIPVQKGTTPEGIYSAEFDIASSTSPIYVSQGESHLSIKDSYSFEYEVIKTSGDGNIYVDSTKSNIIFNDSSDSDFHIHANNAFFHYSGEDQINYITCRLTIKLIDANGHEVCYKSIDISFEEE